MIVNGARLLEREGTLSRVGTACAGVDAALRGGLRRGTITEVYGESGSGKTQFCLQATLACCDKGAVYVSTEVFPTRRLRQLLEVAARARHVSYATLADNVHIRQLTEEEELMHCLRVEVPALLSNRSADLLVVDSVAAVYRVAYDNYMERAQRMRELAVQLLNIARQHNVAIICINQVTSVFSDSAREPVPSLGLSWSNMVSTRLRVAKTELRVAESSADHVRSNVEEKSANGNNAGPDCQMSDLESNKTLEQCNKDTKRTVNDNCNLFNCKKSVVCNKSGLECNKSGLKCNEPDLERNKPDLECNRSGLKCNELGLECNRSGLKCNEPGLECNNQSERNCIVRTLKVVFAPDLPNSEVRFIVTMSGIKSVTLN